VTARPLFEESRSRGCIILALPSPPIDLHHTVHCNYNFNIISVSFLWLEFAAACPVPLWFPRGLPVFRSFPFPFRFL